MKYNIEKSLHVGDQMNAYVDVHRALWTNSCMPRREFKVKNILHICIYINIHFNFSAPEITNFKQLNAENKNSKRWEPHKEMGRT